jgi:retron-type reverse transcriptase
VLTTRCRTTWAVEGDIKGFFDNIDHEILLGVLSKKIADGRIIELIRRFLKAGYLEFHQVRNSLTGCPQGNLVSPILTNIYLQELDIFMEELCRVKSSKKKRKAANPLYKIGLPKGKGSKGGRLQNGRQSLGENEGTTLRKPYGL